MTPSGAEKPASAEGFGILIVAHGHLAEEMVRVVEKILGSRQSIETVSMGWDDDVAAARARIQEALQKADRGRGVLVLTDMFGGTPTNVALPFLKEGDVEIVTGVNLPMILKIPNVRQFGGTLREAADQLRDLGQRAIQLATQYLEKPRGA